MSRWVGLGAALAAALAWEGVRAGVPVPVGKDEPVVPDAPEAGCELFTAARARTTPDRCLACHDGSAGRAVMYLGKATRDARLDHPVDVPYGEASARARNLAPLAQLPSDVVLVDGKISCTTCHDGASTRPGRVAADLVTLCTSCHRM